MSGRGLGKTQGNYVEKRIGTKTSDELILTVGGYKWKKVSQAPDGTVFKQNFDKVAKNRSGPWVDKDDAIDEIRKEYSTKMSKKEVVYGSPRKAKKSPMKKKLRAMTMSPKRSPIKRKSTTKSSPKKNVSSVKAKGSCPPGSPPPKYTCVRGHWRKQK
jgi:hypothetical protein